MATYGELKWASLIASKPLLLSLAKSGNFVTLETTYRGIGWFATPSTRPDLFSFPEFMSHSVSERAPYRHFLIFSREEEEGVHWITAKLRVLWPASRWVRSRTHQTALYYYDPEKVVVRIPRVTSVFVPGKREFKVVEAYAATPKNSLVPRTTRNARVVLTVPRLMNLAFTADRQLAKSKLANRRSSSTGFTGKKQPRLNPETVLGSNINASESSGSSYSEFDAKNIEVLFRQFSSTTTPRFGSISSSKLPVNPYSLVYRKTNNPTAITQKIGITPGPWAGYYFHNWNNCRQMFLGVLPVPSHSASVYNQAVGRLISKTKSGISSNIALNILEGRQLNSLIAGNATKIAKAVALVKRGQFGQAAKVLTTGRKSTRFGPQPSASGSVASNWLALQYGWKPLLSDIDGAMRLLASRFREEYPIEEVRSSAKVRTFSMTDVKAPSPATNVIGKQEVMLTSVARLGIRFSVDPSVSTYLNQTGFTNPPLLAWEVLPWSFVVDWFLPVGPYLETLSAWKGLVFYNGFATKFTRQTIFAGVQFDGVLSSETVFRHRMRGAFNQVYVLHDREKLLTFPQMESIPLKNPLSFGHALNALALMRLQFS